ncbi:MAG: FAD-dependent oxidoreductase [Myxococcales bacterium]|nr:FAD-dependent oxidoreductase [Myxococcales bacterium]
MPNYATSLWTDDSEVAPRHPKLTGHRRFDVAIIGAGITGITATLLLKRMGKSVAVLESRRVGKGETSKTTAHLTQSLDTRYHSLLDRFGLETTRLVARSQRDAIERIAEFTTELSIPCEFERLPGYLYAAQRAHAEEIEREADACMRLGMDVTLMDHAPLPFDTFRTLRFENQARFQPRRYVLALAERIPGDGCEIFEETQVLDVEEPDRCRVITEGGVLTADHVIVAAHVPVNDRLRMATKIPAYRSYALAARLPTPDPIGLFWDTEDPYHYIRTHVTQDGSNMLIVGGSDHKVGQETDTTRPFEALERYVEGHFGPLPIEQRWSGQIIDPLDGLAYIGRNPLSRHVYIATGFAGQGMTMGTLAAMILSDRVLGHKNRYAHTYRPSRWASFASAKKFVMENVDFPLHMLRDRLRPTRTKPDDLPAGEGALLVHEGRQLAVYRDHAGALHALSPVCPHMGCLVHWNGAEKSWDCPCHGSRFDTRGAVLNGPATRALAPQTLADDPPQPHAPTNVPAQEQAHPGAHPQR